MSDRGVSSWTEHSGKVFTGAGIEIAGHQLMPDLSLIGPDRVDQLDEEGFHVPVGELLPAR